MYFLGSLTETESAIIKPKICAAFKHALANTFPTTFCLACGETDMSGGRGCNCENCYEKKMALIRQLETSGDASSAIVFGVHPGEESDEVTMVCRSGKWAGAPGAFQKWMRETLAEWHKCDVTIKEKN